MRRLNPCRATSLRDETLLQYLPVICVTATSEHAILLERFAHAHMTAFEPAMCLDLASDAERSMDREKYHRHAANMLIKLLQRASAKTIAQLSAGRTALRNKIRDQTVVLCKEDFNNSLDL